MSGVTINRHMHLLAALVAGLAMSAAAAGYGGGGHSGGGGGGGGGSHGGFGGHGGWGGGHHGGYGGWRGGYGGWRGGWGYGGWGWGGLGLFYAALPFYYSTLWWDGVPYYYADNAFYIWNDGENAYEAVNPPPEVANLVSSQSSTLVNLYAYPKNGQSLEQQTKDRADCYDWAVKQTGFTPAGADSTGPKQPTPASAVKDPSNPVGNRHDYLRAQAACLEGRGYTVR
jgi:hypothetical protein